MHVVNKEKKLTNCQSNENQFVKEILTTLLKWTIPFYFHLEWIP